MIQIFFDMPDESLMPFNGSEERAGKEMRMAAAAKFYEMGQMSSGAAARLAGIPRALFLIRLTDYGVNTFRTDEDELDKETRLA